MDDTETRQRGRPPLPVEQRLEHTVGVRLRRDQIAVLKAIRAERHGEGDLASIARELIAEAIEARRLARASRDREDQR